uniref:NADH dehydrogenase subunit 5 n=1 Tax=Menacanthus cornutus TaxID=1491751 RepID=UPI002001BA90|nr:NADH dehydrogenase subunit 5 [Menacanthus cornutus]UNZ12993.1 NADH dehydrogenase subunit 5 [Menacanthus cornutus]
MHLTFILLSSLLMIYLLNNLLTLTVFGELVLLNMPMISLSVKIDSYSMIFLMTITVIFSSVFSFGHHYMSSDSNSKRFKMILILFGVSMVLMVISGDFFTTFIAWDSLGVTSFLLVMYYPSYKSLNAGILVYSLNRVGDCFFVVNMVIILMFSSKSWLMSSIEFSSYASILLILTAITKSALIPFSSWLPAAMEAPTPVSALVHSSTLVTAGIYLLFRYQHLWISDSFMCFLLVGLSSSTAFVASFIALCESDVKKVIALSTLSQLGLIMLTFSLGFIEVGFFHMITHAYFKALLFMVAGYLIHFSSGFQSMSKLTLNFNSPKLFMIYMGSHMALCGIPFMSGFYSKDMVIDEMVKNNYSLIFLFMVYLSFMLTTCYCFRLLWFFLNNSMNWVNMSDDGDDYINTMFLMFMLCCVSGSVYYWMMIPPVYYVDNSKWIVLLCLTSAFIFTWFNKKQSIILSYYKWVADNMYKYLFSNMFVLSKNYVNSSDYFSIVGYFHEIATNKINFISKFINYSGTFFMYSFDLVLILTIVLLMIL